MTTKQHRDRERASLSPLRLASWHWVCLGAWFCAWCLSLLADDEEQEAFHLAPGTKQNKYQKDGKTTTCASCGTFICVLEACVVALSSAQRGVRGLAVVGVLLR